jgi:hypothetical protein
MGFAGTGGSRQQAYVPMGYVATGKVAGSSGFPVGFLMGVDGG